MNGVEKYFRNFVLISLEILGTGPIASVVCPSVPSGLDKINWDRRPINFVIVVGWGSLQLSKTWGYEKPQRSISFSLLVQH